MQQLKDLHLSMVLLKRKTAVLNLKLEKLKIGLVLDLALKIILLASRINLCVFILFYLR